MTTVVTLLVVAACLGLMMWFLHRRSADRAAAEIDVSELRPEAERRLQLLRDADKSLDGSEFISQSELASWKSQHGKALDFARDSKIADALEPSDRAEYQVLCKHLSDVDKRTLDLNGQFILRRLAEDSDRFDNIETYPLTQQQRLAIVTSEDATLVVAGAGTGKTSTIVGKVDYLLRHGLAKPDEILVLAFNKKASEDLEERINRADPSGSVTTSTFHAFGYRILGETEGRRPAVSKLSEDSRELNRFIRERVREMLQDPDDHLLITRWFSTYLDEPAAPDPTLTPDEIIRRERSLGLRALNGTLMNSRQEVKIANWLTLNGVEWEYELPYPIDVATPMKRQYQPDFYLPKYNLYLEHFGIGCDGSTAPHVDALRYIESMEWKREVHFEHGTILLETCSCDDEQGKLIARLELLLIENGVSTRPLTQDEIDHITSEANRPFSDFVLLISQFLAVFKGGGADFGKVDARSRSLRDSVFLEIFRKIFAAYEKELNDAGEIDFDDMINRSLEYVRKDQFRARFKYIVVDEFQDISENRLALLLALRAQVSHARLFVVGDDWQSIYRFAGSDVSLITDLAKHAGATARVDLDKTFRYRQELLDVSAMFITKNPAQLKKKILAHDGPAGSPPISIILSSSEAWKDKNPGGLTMALEDISRRAGKKRASVYILGRYNFNRPDEFGELQATWKARNLDVEFFTAHSSKGKEADYVVVVGLEAGEYGFPSNVSDDPVMRMVLSEPEEFLYAEERRLFYVAITRARHHVFILASQDKSSTFVADDLLQPPMDSFTSTNYIGEISERQRCPQCSGKTIKRRDGQYGTFWACTNFPSCRGRLPACPECRSGGLLERVKGRRTTFHCTDCGYETEQCPRCRRGFLVERESFRGPFLACSEWNGGMGCKYTKDIPVNQSAERS